MTNYEKIKNIEISGAKPFAGLSRITLADAIRITSCRICPVGAAICADSELPCGELILDWLEADND